MKYAKLIFLLFNSIIWGKEVEFQLIRRSYLDKGITHYKYLDFYEEGEPYTGEVTSYDSFDNLNIVCNYKNGKLHGSYKSYRSDRRLYEDFIYVNGEVIEATMTTYNSSGKLTFHSYYNKADGWDITTSYSKDGKKNSFSKKKRLKYEDLNRITFYEVYYFYHDNGEIMTAYDFFMEEGAQLPSGTEKNYSEDGKIQSEKKYNGKENYIIENNYMKNEAIRESKTYKYYSIDQASILESSSDNFLHGIYKKYHINSDRATKESLYEHGKQVEYTYYYANGNTFQKLEREIDGTSSYKKYYENGNLWEEYTEKNDRRIGTLKEYNINGGLYKEINYISKNERVIKFFYDSGVLFQKLIVNEESENLKFKVFYKTGELLKNMESENMPKMYGNYFYEVLEEGYYTENTITYYHKNGNISGLRRGSIANMEFYEEDGKTQIISDQLYMSGYSLDGNEYSLNDQIIKERRNGYVKHYHENGMLASENALDDKERIDGELISYNLIGTPRMKKNYKNGKEDNIRIVFYDNGIIISEEVYKNDIRERIIRENYENGFRKSEYGEEKKKLIQYDEFGEEIEERKW